MPKINDGGPAFPNELPAWQTCPRCNGQVSRVGLSLRDYFAAAALTGWLAWSPGVGVQTAAAESAERAYEYADAMIAERQKARPE